MIETSAFLHQHQRPRKSVETPEGEVFYIEASWEDYRLAYELAQTVLKASLHELSPGARDLFERLTDVEPEFTRREVRNLTGWPQTRVVDTLNELESMEYIVRTAGSNGTTIRYTAVLQTAGLASGGQAVSPMHQILHPDQLRDILKKPEAKP